MAVTATVTTTRPSTAVSKAGVVAVTATLVLVVGVLAIIDITQGTASAGAAEVFKALTGQADSADTSVVIASRLPRMTAGLLVGAALGVAGAALQAVSRNVLASPDTLAVNAGSYLMLGLVATTGISLPQLASSGVAFIGGLAAAAVVLGLSGLGTGTVRLVLAGTALTLGLTAITDGLLLLFPVETEGLYHWNQGSIAQNGFDGVVQMAPLVVIGLVGLLLVAHRVDALALGDDAARGLGVPVRSTRITVVVLGALLSAAAVTLAGPIGFVGLCAPALVRPLARRLRAFTEARASFPLAGLVGAGLVLGSDVLLRALVASDTAVAVPTGVITSLVGAVFLIVMAARQRDTATSEAPDRLRIRSRAAFLITTAVLVAVLVAMTVAGVLLGDSKLLLGDVVNWAQGRAAQSISFVLDTRVPRVLAALLAGAALALAGTLVQAVTRNPLAEPRLLGISGGAGLGAVILVTTVPLAGSWGLAGAAFAGAAAAAVLVFGLAARDGFQQNRLVLVGMGVATATTALISLLIVLTDPFNATKALTWLSGSTYGRTLPDVVPIAACSWWGWQLPSPAAHNSTSCRSTRTPRGSWGSACRAGAWASSCSASCSPPARSPPPDDRLRRPGGPPRGPGPRGPASCAGGAGLRPARCGPRLHRGSPRPYGHRARPGRRGSDDGAHRHPVLPVSAGTDAPLTRRSARSRW